MKSLRKIDLYGQLVLTLLMVLSIPIFSFYGFLIGLLFLGCWQTISAIVNTITFFNIGRRKQILLYWKLWIADITFLILLLLVDKNSYAPDVTFILWIPMIGAVILAGYYWEVCFQLIDFISLRNELDGLTKSKH